MRRIFTLFVPLFFISWLVNAQSITPSAGALPALSTTYGTVSAEQSFTFTATNLGNSATLTVTAPTGFEVSSTSGSGFGPTATYTASSTGGGDINPAVTCYVRLKASASVAGSPYSGNITLVSGATTANKATTASTVSAKALTMSGLSVPGSKVYDGTTAAVVSGSPALQASETIGTGNSSDGIPYTGDVVSITGTPTGTYNSKNVGATTVAFGGLSLTGAQATNYSLTIQASTGATISAKTLTITGITVPGSKVYNGNTVAVVSGSPALQSTETGGTGSTSDGKPYTGDVVSITGSVSGAYNTKDVLTANLVTFSGLSLTGADFANYSLNQGTTAATITPKALTMSGLTVPGSKVYDGTTAAVVSGSPALQSSEAVGAGSTGDGIPYTGDVVSITGSASGSYNTKDVLTANAVTFSGLSLTGADFANYTLTIQSSTGATITTKALTVTGATANNKAFDGTTVATLAGSPALLASETGGTGSTGDGKPYTGDAASLNSGAATGTFASAGPGVGITVNTSGYVLTGGDASNYTVTQPTLSATIFAVQPTVQSTAMVFSSVTNTTLTVSWTIPGAGGGTNRILVVKQGGSPTAPTDGTSYTANTVIGSVTSGEITAAGSFVVYTGTGNTVSLTGFTANLSYTFNLYEFNGSGGTENYLTTSPLTNNQTTEDEPANYPTGLTASATSSVITLNWTGSIGSPAPANYLVLARDVTNGGSFPAFSDGSAVPASDNNITGGSNNGVVSVAFGTNTYNGWAGGGLTPGHQYEFQINPYTTAGIINPDYKTGGAPTVQVFVEPSTSASTPTFANTLPTSFDVTLAGGTGASKYLVIRNTVVTAPTNPTDGTTYSVGSTALGGTVVYNGVAGTFNDSGLSSLTTYYYTVFDYAGSAGLENYRTTSPATANHSTVCQPPTGQATSVVFSSVLASSMTISWTSSGTSNGALVLLNDNNSASAFSPTSGTSYAGNTVFGNGTDLEGGGGVTQSMFFAAGNSVAVTGLSASQAYYARVYEYMSTGTCYNLSSPASATQTTASASQSSTLALIGAAPTISSVANTSGSKIAAFQFKITDTSAGDNVPTRFSGLTFRPGTGNNVTFTDLIGNTTVELRDASGNSQTANISVTSNTIAITSIANNTSSSGDQTNRLGIVNDANNKTYTLNIWVNNPLTGTATDGQKLTLSLAAADVAIVAGASGMLSTTSAETGPSNGVIDVTATVLAFSNEPPAAATATVPFGVLNQPILTAKDANGNSDLSTISASVTTPDATLNPTSAPTGFTNGTMNFSTANTFNYASTGTSRMTVTTTSAPSGLAVTSTVSTVVSAQTTLGGSALAMSTSPLTNSTVGVISGGSATNAVLGFSLQTSGSTLTLSDVNFATIPVSTTGLVKNFKLYSNTSDSFTGATQVGTTSASSPSFSGLSVSLNGSATYFYLVCDVEDYFSSFNPTIQFSIATSGLTISTGNKVGSAQTGAIYTLQDITPPIVQSITVVPPPTTNTWSTTNGTSASTVTFRVTFSEPVSGIQYAGGNKNFSTFVSGPVVTGSMFGPGATTSNYVDVTVPSVSGQGKLTLNFTENDNISDVAGNPVGGIGFGNGNFPGTFTGNSFYSIVLQQPNAVAGFSITSVNLEIYINYSITAGGGQAPTNYLIMARESQGATPFPTFGTPGVFDDGILLTDDTYDGTYGQYNGDGLYILNVTKSGISQSGFIDGLRSGEYFDFIIYPYTKSSFYSDDNIDYGPPTTITNYFIPVGSNSTLSGAPVTNTILSNVDTQPEAQNVFSFSVTDGTGSGGWETAPTAFSGVTINELVGTDNVINWSSIIQGAELYDISSPTTFVTASSITSNQIIFTGIPSTTTGDLGYVPHSTQNLTPNTPITKNYGLRIYFKNSSGTLNGQDGKILAFTVKDTDFNYHTPAGTPTDHQASTTISAGSTASSGVNTIDIQATHLRIVTDATSPIGVAHNFPASMVINAEDDNSNLDAGYSNTASITNTGYATSVQSFISKNFVAGVLTLSNFNFVSPVTATSIKITGAGVPAVGSVTSAVPVTAVISSLSKISLGAASPSLVLSTSTTQATATQVLEFVVQDDLGADIAAFTDNDGLPTQIKQIKINPGSNNDATYFTDWTQVIQGAQLTELNGGTSISISSTLSTSGVIAANYLQFDLTQGTFLSFISDGGSNTYRLSIWLKSPMPTTLLSDNIDNKFFDFIVDQSSVTNFPNPATSITSSYQTGSATSGAGKNKVDVSAFQLDFTTQPPTTQSYDVNLTSTPIVKARDVNQNLDLNYGSTGTLSAVFVPIIPNTIAHSYPLSSTSFVFSSGVATLSSVAVQSSGNGVNNDHVYLQITAPSVNAGLSSTITLTYSGNSNVVTASFSHPTNIDYGSTTGQNNQTSDITATTGTTIEKFTVQDGGGSSDADGTSTVVDAITFNLQNSVYLQKIALYNSSNQEVAETTVSGSTVSFTGLSSAANKIVAPDNGSIDFTVKVSFQSVVVDNAVVNINVSSISAGGVSSAFSGGASTTMAALGTDENAIEVTATQLDITTPASSASASISSDFPGGGTNIVVKARDIHANLDVDFTGIITSLTNTTGATMVNGPTIGTSAFGAPNNPPGVYDFATNFQYTTGSNGDNVSLTIKADNTGGNSGTNCGVNAICSGISPTITLQISFESSLQLDPTFKPVIVPTIPNVGYISYLDSATFSTSTNGYEIIRAMVVDGSKTNYNYKNQYNQTGILDTQSDAELNGNGDLDGAKTVLTNLKLRVFGAASLSRIALYDSTGTYIPNTLIDVTSLGISRSPSNGVDTTSYVFTWPTSAGNLVTANDNSQAPFSVRATFRKTSSHLRDQDIIKVRLIAATLGTGSQFYQKNVPGYNAGGSYNATPQPVGKVDVVATSLDFTTPPSSYAGVNEPIGTDPSTNQPYSYGNPAALTSMPVTTAGIVSARDKFGNVDTGFTPSTITLKDNASNTLTQPTPVLSFNNGVMKLDGIKYPVAVGSNGAITVITTGPTYENITGTSGPNALPCSTVNVVDISVSYDKTGVLGASSGTQALKGGTSNNIIFGMKFVANATAGSEPKLSKFIISFKEANSTGSGKNWYEYTGYPSKVIFSNFKVYINGTATPITGSISKGYSTNVNELDQVIVSLSPAVSVPASGITFYLSADVDPSSTNGTQSLVPYFVDAGYGSTTDANSLVTTGTSVSFINGSTSTIGEFDGTTFSFATTQAPYLRADINLYPDTKTSPYAGQPNVDPALSHITLQFSTDVAALDSLELTNGDQYVGELWNRDKNIKVADLLLNTTLSAGGTPDKEGIVTGNTVNVNNLLIYDLVNQTGPLVNDEVYYVKIKQGSYDPITKEKHGISDYGLNFFGGITDNSTLYFKIASNQPINLTSAVSNYDTKSVGTLTTNFDQLGTAYFCAVNGFVYTTGTGTVSVPAYSSIVNGTNTFFTTELSVGSKFRDASGAINGIVTSIYSDTQLALDSYLNSSTGLVGSAFQYAKLATGTISSSSGSPVITGTGTSFSTEFKVGSIVRTGSNPLGTIIGTVASIASPTSLTLTTNASLNYSGSAAYPADAPTASDLKNGTYSGNGLVGAEGKYTITSVNASQTATFPANFDSDNYYSTNFSNSYDVYIYAENDAPNPVPAPKVYTYPALIDSIFNYQLFYTPNNNYYDPNAALYNYYYGTPITHNDIIICPDSYVTTTTPLLISETSDPAFFSKTKNSLPTQQNCNIVLPTGFEFDTKSFPTLQLTGSDWTGATNMSYTSNSILNITFYNSGSNSLDLMAISGLRVIGKAQSNSGNIQWFYGDNMFSNRIVHYFFSSTPINATSGAVYQDPNTGGYFTVTTTSTGNTYLITESYDSPAATGTLNLFSGTGDATVNYYYTFSYNYSPVPAFPLAKISLNNTKALPNFTNSYWYSNDSVPGQSPFPLVNASTSATYDLSATNAFRKTVNAIPDNYIDADPNAKNSVRLLPMTPPYSSNANNTFAQGDFKANIYSGAGVSGDLLNLLSATKNAPFNITVSHTDLNGCYTTQSQQYIVYDHNNPISKKLGVTQNSSIDATTSQQSQPGTNQDLVNPNFSVNGGTPGTPALVPSPTLLYNEKAGYSLLQLNVDLPASELLLNSQNNSSQLISNTTTDNTWRRVIRDSLLQAPVNVPIGSLNYFNNYTWDYSPILKHKPIGYTNVYDYFKKTSQKGNHFWDGGSLGKIEFTGSYQSTADNSVYVPYRQQVELFLPAVPVVETQTQPQNYDTLDIASNIIPNNNKNQYPSTKTYRATGYPGTAIYCEYGGKITLQAFPTPDNGATSVGKFIIYDFSKWGATATSGTGTISVTNSALVVGAGTSFMNTPADVQPNAILFDVTTGKQIGVVQSVQDATHLTLYSWSSANLTGSGFKYLNPLPATGFNDVGNGTMTLDPLAQKNSYNDILVSYSFKPNVSPAWGIGSAVIRVSPNPVPAFTVSSIVATSNSASGPASFDKYCAGSIITFSDASTIGASSTPNQNSIAKYDWDFGDGNSGQNHLTGAGGTNLTVADYQPIPSISIQPGIGYGSNNTTTTYYSLPVTGGGNNDAYVDVTVTNGSVSAVKWSTDATKGPIGYGTGYLPGDVLSATFPQGITGTGFSFIRGPIQTYNAPSHYYGASSTYNLALNLISNWGCQSLAVPLANNVKTIQPLSSNVLYSGIPSTSVGAYAAQLVVGSIPVVDYNFTGNCATQAVTFTDKSTNASDPTSKFDWYFDYATSQTADATTNTPLGTTTNTYANSGLYTSQLTTTTTLGCQAAKQKLLGQLKPLTQNIIDFEADDAGFLPLDISLQGPSGTYIADAQQDQSYIGRASWTWGTTSGKTHAAFQTSGNSTYNKIWSTSKSNNTYYHNNSKQGENSALYAACLTVNVPRPMISFDAYVDVANGEGLVLQYSSDQKNILDPTKKWYPFGADTTNYSILPGIDWYNGVGLSTIPGSYSVNGVVYGHNSTGLGWAGSAGSWIHPKHAMDNGNLDLSNKALELRFVFTSSSGPDSVTVGNNHYDGVAIDNIRFGSRTRTILFENFTSTDAGGNSGLNTQIQSDDAAISAFVVKNINSTQLVDINYHVGFVGQDPFNIDNASDPGARALYYGVQKVPFAFLDGSHYFDNSTPPKTNPDLFQYWGQAQYDLNTLKLAQADFNNVVTANPDGSLNIDVNFTPLLDLPFGIGGTTLQVAVLEKVITSAPSYGKITTGETSFEYVLKKLLPSAVGTQFANPIVAGTPISAGTFKYQPQNLHSTVLTVIVFLQRESTKEVYQADLIDNIPVNPLVTGVEPLSAENIRLYPNPADRELTIELPSPAKESTTLRLANQLGQFIELDAFKEGEQMKTISTHALSEGVYILQIGGNNSAVRTKVVVVHK